MGPRVLENGTVWRETDVKETAHPDRDDAFSRWEGEGGARKPPAEAWDTRVDAESPRRPAATIGLRDGLVSNVGGGLVRATNDDSLRTGNGGKVQPEAAGQ